LHFFQQKLHAFLLQLMLLTAVALHAHSQQAGRHIIYHATVCGTQWERTGVWLIILPEAN